jgi:hypothetical protein
MQCIAFIASILSTVWTDTRFTIHSMSLGLDGSDVLLLVRSPIAAMVFSEIGMIFQRQLAWFGRSNLLNHYCIPLNLYGQQNKPDIIFG